MSRSYCNLLYHIVFSTKERCPWLAPEIRNRVHEYLGGGINGEGGIPLMINGTDDHVHIYARLRQDKAISDVVRNLKSSASGWIHKACQGLGGFAWQEGFGAFTVSPSKSAGLIRYIQCQEEHHRRRTFKEELLELLRRHRVEFDERYLWR